MIFIIDAIKQVLLWFIENFIKDVYEGIKRWVKNPKRKLYPIIIVVVLILTVFGVWYSPQVQKVTKVADVKWTMISFLGKETDKIILSQAPRRLKDKIYNMTKGRFIIEIDKKAQINIDTDSILEKVSNGDLDCAYNGIYYNKDKYRPLFFGSAIPFGLNTQQQNAWLYYKKDPNDELTFMQSIYQRSNLNLNVIPFPVAATGGQMGGWFKKEINSIKDFDGLVMRIPGLGAEVLTKFGVITDEDKRGQPLRSNEISGALADKTIDAAEWTGPHDDVKLGLNENTQYYYYPGWWEPGTTFDIQVNLKKWNKLPAHYQAIFKAACHETLMEILAEYDQKNGEQLKQIKQTKTVKPFSAEIMQEAEEETNKLLNFYAQGNPLFKEVYDEWRTFKTRIQGWHNTVNDYAYKREAE
ncbi:ABC transporter substrate-binding protein [Moorena sp. SIO4G3]|uniref:TRAP transporter substrate-binding protein n=1 Tax=Moorena sp. SIO4G3 TaxID=2607821 RepID=UPI00142C9607|nr:ABC transporter substrate-binding protein [Moorena sp. SIO4G3]NEO75202.1 ABC transporter substrate-binding protein [Moorena sp. SIO4G3]